MILEQGVSLRTNQDPSGLFSEAILRAHIYHLPTTLSSLVVIPTSCYGLGTQSCCLVAYGLLIGYSESYQKLGMLSKSAQGQS